MINISHPKINGKPPAKKSIIRKDLIESKHQDVRQKSTVFEQNDNIPHIIQSEKADNNQNLIETTTFEQLCNMISDLEKNATVKISEIDQLQQQTEIDKSGKKHGLNGKMYDDIMSFLTELEEGSHTDDVKNDIEMINGTMLGDIFGDTMDRLPNDNCDGTNINDQMHCALRDDLVTVQLQLREKEAAISLLREQLKAERKIACEKLNSQKRSSSHMSQKLKEKYEGIVKRHQKFVEQLISEKTDLTEKCNSLAQCVKEIEIKMQRDLKASADRHVVELQKAKEHYAAAEKVKRERWIESRTTKIKEMTVKGLEPELRAMMEQHAEEIQRLRNVHAKELQDTELRVVRRSNEQLEQSRLELNATHERMLTNEKNILWTRYQKELEQQEHMFKEKEEKLNAELRRSEEKFNKELKERDSEMDATLQMIHTRYQRETDALKQQHVTEMQTFQDSMKTKWECWLANYEKQQNSRISQMANMIKDEYTRERDRQIELVIQRLEQDSRTAKLSLQHSFDCKLRSLTEKFDMDLQTAKNNEQLCKEKLTQMMEKVENTQMQLQQTDSKLQECSSKLQKANEVIEQLVIQRDSAREYARQEIGEEKRQLEEKIGSLHQEITRINANKDSLMVQLHSRIKLIMTQKMLTIKGLNREILDVRVKCKYLEKLLDQQRKEYILNNV